MNGVKMTAERIRQSTGDYSEILKFPARYGARLSQNFTTTVSLLHVDVIYSLTYTFDRILPLS